MIDKPAFPTIERELDFQGTYAYYSIPGMTLRDSFAGQAMLGEIVSQGLEGREPEHIAGMAYEMADAMIKARELEP